MKGARSVMMHHRRIGDDNFGGDAGVPSPFYEEGENSGFADGLFSDTFLFCSRLSDS